ncbi:MAG: hypothetical protein GC154_10140 [bacterium]|nr:hypothetical protein [bacterium]
MVRAARNAHKTRGSGVKLGRGRRYATGIDIGHFAVKIITLGGDDEGKIEFRRATVERVPESNGAEYPEELHARQKEALKAALKKHGKLDGRVVLGFPRALSSVRYLTLPSSNPDEIREMLYYDVERHVPFPIDDLEISFEMLGMANENEARILMVCAPYSEIEPYIEMCADLRVYPDSVLLNAMADAEAYGKGLGEQETAAVVNFGRSTSTLSVVRDGKLLFSRNLPISETRLLEGFAGAKTWRDLQGRVTAAGALNPRERDHFSQWVDHLGLELMRSMSAFMCEENSSKIGRLILSGGAGFFPAGPPRGLTVRVKTNAAIEPALNGTIPPGDGYHPTQLSTAAGLAIRGLRKEPDTLSLLPEAVVQERKNQAASATRKNVAVMLFMIVALLGAAGYLRWHENYKVQSSVETYYTDLMKETSKVQTMRKKIETVEHYLDSEQSCLKVIQKVLEVLPPRTYIRNLTFSKRQTLEITGQVQTEEEVQQIHRALIDLRPSPNGEAFFDLVQPRATTTKTLELGLGKMIVREFQFNCVLKWEEDKKK